MKLYYTPGACSLASRISLHEANIAADFERVDLEAKRTERGHDYIEINPAGSVPMLVLNDGERVTENVAILTLITDHQPELRLGGELGRIRLIEMLSYLSTELHVAFKPFFHTEDPAERQKAAEAVAKRLDLIANHVRELYLFGPRFTVADAYLFVMLRWALGLGVPIPTQLHGYFERVAERPTVRQALAEEELEVPPLPKAVAPVEPTLS